MRVRIGIMAFLFLLNSSSSLFARKSYRLDGYMGVQGGESFHYVMDLEDSTGNFLSGYAYTYKNENNSVKARVIAVVDRVQKTLKIQEQEIIYNHGFESNVTICLVNALLKWDTANGNLSGSLITQTAGNGNTCSTGSISFIKKDQIEQLFTTPIPIKPIAQTNNDKQNENNFFKLRENPNQKLHTYFEQKAKEDTLTINKPNQKVLENNKASSQKQSLKVKEITEGNEVTYNWHSSQIVFEIWDGGEIDNDRVNVSFNGKVVLSDYTLAREKRKLVFQLTTGEPNIITITANNEGVIPPNTANILLIDGEKSYSVLAYNKTGKTAIIKIKKSHP